MKSLVVGKSKSSQHKMKVFLDGTCNGSRWRNRIMIWLYDFGVDYFNPVVDDWTEDAQKREEKEKQICDYRLYCITPKMKGVFSIAEVVDDSNKRPDKTILIVLQTDDDDKFPEFQKKSLQAVMRMVHSNGVAVFTDLRSAAVWLSEQK